MAKYRIEISIESDSYEVEADSQEEAEEIAKYISSGIYTQLDGRFGVSSDVVEIED